MFDRIHHEGFCSWAFLCGRFLITDSISLVVIGLFSLSVFPWFSFPKLYISRDLSIFSRLSNLAGKPETKRSSHVVTLNQLWGKTRLSVRNFSTPLMWSFLVKVVQRSGSHPSLCFRIFTLVYFLWIVTSYFLSEGNWN